MKSVFLLVLFLILCITFVNARHRSTKAFEYDRIDEVKRECSSILPPDFDHKRYGNQLYRLPEKLSFVNGDWWQDLDKAQLIPYDDKPNGFLDHSSPFNLISFWITDVDDAHRSNNSVNINGVLQLSVMTGELFTSKPYERYPMFNMYPGNSELRMSFQGIVTYTEENNGEIVMCLLGNAVLPSRGPDPNNPWGWVKEPGYINQPPHIHDDRILMVVHYPDTFTVKKRGIYGSLKSLNPKSSQKYFEEIHISASLSRSANYEFSSEKLVSNFKACETSFADKDLGTLKGANICCKLEHFLREDPLTVVPNWRCNGTEDFCSKLGPFESDASINETNGSFKGVALHLQDIRCEKPCSETEGKHGGSVKVAMVIRVGPPSDDIYYTTRQRTGLKKMTLSAEGLWDPSSGQLCMVGCRVNKEGDGCDSRICLYTPLMFSIKQRSVILGSISSIEESNMSYFPLSFKKRVDYAQELSFNQYYEYSKIELAQAVVEKHERYSFETVIKKRFLSFPKVKLPESLDSFLNGLSLLKKDLTFYHPASTPGRSRSQPYVEIEILSLGPLFGKYWTLQNDSIIREDTPLNVSAQLSVTGANYGNFSEVFVEGLYHPIVGKMYLVGCRDVRAYSNLLYESTTDLKDGFDCLIEVVVSYPPTTNRWLVNPTPRISIASQRNNLDPLFFTPINLQTVQLTYQDQREDISSSNRGGQGTLQVLTSLIGICCILSQLFYIKQNLDSVHYVSLVMIAIQALGYVFPLVTGVESLVDLNESTSTYTTNQRIQVIDYMFKKILVLVSFLLTLRLYQKVWRFRNRILSHHMPSDRPILLITIFIHVFGFGWFLIVHKLQSWLVGLDVYLGLVQDLFLLPQVIGNLIWQIDCKPLRKSYFVGLTVIRLLPHVYAYRSLTNLFHSSAKFSEFVSRYPKFHSKQGAIGIPAITIFLVIAVYIQQTWSYEKLGNTFTLYTFRLFPHRSMVYERLLPVEVEAGPNSGFNGLMKTLQRRRGWK
ncbi:uncharacterized protein LOC111910542 [Lactuca sativa]|uniref:uncharacterized protein LOC111910542 n=1 Tax=Lactuca sativa TaxID=4236 RepID=UPI000CD8494D|nr:uncharacterized protein LOC111910542 [Lactuca sativa]